MAALVATCVLATGCSGEGGGDEGASPSTGATSAPAPLTGSPAEEDLPPVAGPFAPGRTRIPGFGEVEVRIVPGPDGEPIVLCVLLAETPEQRRQGLTGVTDSDLGGYDGMLFRFPADTTTGFWMRNTPLPLSIAYLDAAGATVDTADMEPCLDDGTDCPTYPPKGPYRTALEVPQGGLAELGLAPGSDARLEVVGHCRPPP